MIKIVDFEEKYIDDVVNIEKEAFSDAWSKEMFLMELVPRGFIFYLCLDDERVVGYLIARHILDEIDILNLAIESSSRRKKLAATLLEKLFDDVDGIRLYSLEVRKSNAPAIRLYEKYGFEQVRIRKNYYESPREDAIVMMKNRMEN